MESKQSRDCEKGVWRMKSMLTPSVSLELCSGVWCRQAEAKEKPQVFLTTGGCTQGGTGVADLK